jgi:uncharacterized protein (DUF433 family)
VLSPEAAFHHALQVFKAECEMFRTGRLYYVGGRIQVNDTSQEVRTIADKLNAHLDAREDKIYYPMPLDALETALEYAARGGLFLPGERTEALPQLVFEYIDLALDILAQCNYALPQTNEEYVEWLQVLRNEILQIRNELIADPKEFLAKYSPSAA